MMGQEQGTDLRVAATRGKEEKDFSHAQADAFAPQHHPGRKKRAGVNAQERVGLLRSG
jgi:hypothetical protein